MFIVCMFEMLEDLQNDDFNILSVEEMPQNSQIFYPRCGQNTSSRFALFQRSKCTNILTVNTSHAENVGGSIRVIPPHPRTHPLKKARSTK